jgi:hypothetical protein
MPSVLKTVIPRIRKALRERGLTATLGRSFLLPLHLLREYRVARSLRPDGQVSEFDRTHGVETDGEFDGWTYLSDLDIPSSNWIEGTDYVPSNPNDLGAYLLALTSSSRISRSSILGPAKAEHCYWHRSTRSNGSWVWSSRQSCIALPKTTSGATPPRRRSVKTSNP